MATHVRNPTESAPPPESEHGTDPGTEHATEEQHVREAQSLDAKSTYEVIRREGQKELERSTDALFWSGLAAGLSMGFSFLTEGILRAKLPDAPWRELVAKLGYCVGFLVVILGSQQLFTENTLTPMVPLLSRKSDTKVGDVLRLWAAVFVANMIGTLLFGLAMAKLAVVEPDIKRALSDIAGEAMRHDWWTTFLHAIYAGWIIALLVWVLPGAEHNKVAVIVVMTWLIAVGGFAHVVAGSSEVFYAAWRGEASWADALAGFVLPSLIGNMVGGITLVAALNHAQATSGE
ncbi:MAG: formate/nitrite transporter family protein [Gemmatimonadetes bacterium]|nr:formate/nitrite transporter family protein [Gemmatimonadota bacterium]